MSQLQERTNITFLAKLNRTEQNSSDDGINVSNWIDVTNICPLLAPTVQTGTGMKAVGIDLQENVDLMLEKYSLGSSAYCCLIDRKVAKHL